jgi:hypothetical protein
MDRLTPAYEQLAEALKNKMNVVAVNCEQHGTFCRQQGVLGYPTLKLCVSSCHWLIQAQEEHVRGLCRVQDAQQPEVVCNEGD